MSGASGSSASEVGPGSPVGGAGLGEGVREQLEKARNDPRLSRGRASVADYWDAMGEAEDTRKVAILGLYQLRGCVERYEREHGVSRHDAELAPVHRHAMQPLWEQAELASSVIDNDFAAINAQALVAMNSALDAMVEEFAPAMRDIVVRSLVDQIIKQAEQADVEAASALDEETKKAAIEAMVATVGETLPKLDRLLGSGVERYEARLRGAGLGTAEDRPIPADLDEALTELGAIRDVLQHRASRIDAKALKQAPSLARRYSEGDLVRILRHDFGTYSAAIRCYGQDVSMRPMRAWPEFKKENLPDFSRWRGYYVLGV
jgi:hypothetical protein